MDRNFNEMTETEATLENQLDNLDFMVYQLTTGSIFTADEPRDQATIDKINKLTGKASDQLISAMETLIELKSIVNNSVAFSALCYSFSMRKSIAWLWNDNVLCGKD